jgi:hypothetical protein
MVEDLAEAFERLDNCTADLRSLELTMREYLQKNFDIAADKVEDEAIIRVRLLSPVPVGIRTKVGGIANEARSILDHLAVVLAARNGYPESRSTYFPISETESNFRKDGRSKIKLLSDHDQGLIADLQPIGQKTPLLFGFHEFDIMRKHRRLAVHPGGVDGYGISSPDGGPISIDYILPIFPQVTEIGLDWVPVSRIKARSKISLSPNPTLVFADPPHLKGKPVDLALASLIREVRKIVELFDFRVLESVRI